MKRGLLYAFATLIGFLASTAWSANYSVERTLQISSSPNEAWNIIGDFCDIDDWHPEVESCRLKVIDGALHRILVLADGAESVERRIAVEPGLSYTYKIVSSPLPVDNFVATISITRGDNSTITWSGRFSSDLPETEKTVSEYFEAGLSAIEARLAE